MKYGLTLFICVIAGILIVQTLALMGFPVWLLFLGLPLLAYLQIFALNRYTFRDSLKLESIPEKGYENRREILEGVGNELAELGFIKFDEFYLRISSDAVAYVYHHQTELVYFYHFHLGKIELLDLVTKFDNGFTLSTANSKNAGNLPRPNHKMLQIFEGRSVEELLQHHLEAIKFLSSQGFTPLPTNLVDFREEFLSSFLEIGRELRSFLAPPKLIFWQFSGVHKVYCKSVQQQYLANKLLLP